MRRRLNATTKAHYSQPALHQLAPRLTVGSGSISTAIAVGVS
jgi:hypothetical protein